MLNCLLELCPSHLGSRISVVVEDQLTAILGAQSSVAGRGVNGNQCQLKLLQCEPHLLTSITVDV